MGNRPRQIASIYIGTIIGAGFASGQEILKFFAVYGYKGIFGLIIATLLFILFGGIILIKVYNDKIEGYEEIVENIFGGKIGGIIELIITSFLLAGFCIMLAGSGAIIKEQFNVSYNTGIYIMALATFLTFMFSVKGISTVNTLLVPILLVGVIIISGMVIIKEGFVFSNYKGVGITNTGNFITSAILYASYNSISALVMLSSIRVLIKRKKDCIQGALFGGLGLGVLSFFIMVPCLIFYSDIHNIEIPMLKISESVGGKGKFIYTFILWFSMLTTAIANGFGCIRRISSFLKINQKPIAIVFCIITIPIGKMGFSNLVSILYPIFGYLGMFIVIFMILDFIKNKKRNP